MNIFEEIKQAAFVDELEKIASITSNVNAYILKAKGGLKPLKTFKNRTMRGKQLPDPGQVKYSGAVEDMQLRMYLAKKSEEKAAAAAATAAAAKPVTQSIQSVAKPVVKRPSILSGIAARVRGVGKALRPLRAIRV